MTEPLMMTTAKAAATAPRKRASFHHAFLAVSVGLEAFAVLTRSFRESSTWRPAGNRTGGRFFFPVPRERETGSVSGAPETSRTVSEMISVTPSVSGAPDTVPETDSVSGAPGKSNTVPETFFGAENGGCSLRASRTVSEMIPVGLASVSAAETGFCALSVSRTVSEMISVVPVTLSALGASRTVSETISVVSGTSGDGFPRAPIFAPSEPRPALNVCHAFRALSLAGSGKSIVSPT